jgi:iron complex transport system substrate-binding protein
MNNTHPTNARRRSLIIFIALLLVAVISVIALIELSRRSPGAEISPSAQSVVANTSFPRRLTDASGHTVVINKPPQRIASQTVGTDEILLAICEPARIVRVSPLAFDEHYSLIADEARRANIKAAQNAEEILTANPDLVFVASFSRAETVQVLEAAGAPVFRLGAFNSMEDIRTNIRTVGFLTGEDERAAQLIERMEAEFKAIAARIPQERREGNRLRVMSYGAGGNSAGANTLFDDIVRAAGAVNVTAQEGFDGFPEISAEQIARWNPDFIIASAAPARFEETRASLLANPAIAASDAGKLGRIIVIDTRTLLAVTHHITKAVDALARGLYGNDER